MPRLYVFRHSPSLWFKNDNYMIPIFSASQVKTLDSQEIELEGITSFQLMQRASSALYSKLTDLLAKTEVKSIVVLASGGNNGGDALCVADMLRSKYDVEAFYIKVSDRQTDDFAQAYAKIKDFIKIEEISSVDDIDKIRSASQKEKLCIIDGLLGSGINRVVKKDSFLGNVIDFINSTRREDSMMVSIDLPSGLMGEDRELKDTSRSIINADHTICLQYPKMSTLMPESERFVGDMTWVDFDMKLMKEGSGDVGNMLQFSDFNLKRRPKHGHKGTFGKGLFVAGSQEMPGACMLGSKAAMRSGLGMLYTFTHKDVKPYLINYLPEAICKTYDSTDADALSVLAGLLAMTDAVAIGPGLGTSEDSKILVKTIVNSASENSLLLDADALNIVAADDRLLEILPSNTIITPHPAEFQRLFGKCANRMEMIDRQMEMAKKYNIIIVLKGAYTTISDGNSLFFNPTGNSGMATAGSGDVLSGIILSLLSQGYPAYEAAKLGVFLHGKAGDISASKIGEHSLIASDIIDGIGEAIREMKN